jgi:hypothetical protein
MGKVLARYLFDRGLLCKLYERPQKLTEEQIKQLSLLK